MVHDDTSGISRTLRHGVYKRPSDSEGDKHGAIMDYLCHG